jgi:hypothetical protein
MNYKIGFVFLLGAFVLFLARTANAQGTDVVPFQEQNEELQGTIYIVEPQNNLLIVERNSIPYSFKATATTRVTVSNQRGSLEDLAARKGQQVTVRFRITRGGNMAQEIIAP